MVWRSAAVFPKYSTGRLGSAAHADLARVGARRSPSPRQRRSGWGARRSGPNRMRQRKDAKMRDLELMRGGSGLRLNGAILAQGALGRSLARRRLAAGVTLVEVLIV